MGNGYVIIRGIVFPSAEKAPFVASGVSYLGATEYDKERDLLRCHECGEWYKGIGNHVVNAHKMNLSDYKGRHGLRQSSSLLCLAAQKKISENNLRAGNSSNFHTHVARNKGRRWNIGTRPELTDAGIVSAPAVPRITVTGDGYNASGNVPKSRRPRVDLEARNDRGVCQAQILFKIQTLAAKLHRTPSITELDDIGLRQVTIRRAFNWLPMVAVMEMAGLIPNPRGPSLTGPNKPKSKWNERMPWPKDYFKPDGVRFNSSLSGVE